MDLSTLSIEETAEFISQELNMPDLAALFKEQDVDGETMLELTVLTVREYLPAVTLGKCHKFFRSLKEYQAKQATTVSDSETPPSPRPPTPPPPFEPELMQDELSTACANTVQDLPQTLDTEPRVSPLAKEQEVTEDALRIVGCNTVVSKPRPISSSPVPKDFPIDKLVITKPGGRLMIESGVPTVAGKTAISDALVTLMQKYSNSPGYASQQLKRMAATAFVKRYPSMELGLGFAAAVDSWHRSISCKLANWRSRQKVGDPKMVLMKERYHKQAVQGKLVETTNVLKRRRQDPERELSEDEVEEMEGHRQILISEFQKPAKNRNLRFILQEMELSFPLRRQFVLKEEPHAHSLVKEWPSLRMECVMMKELCHVMPMANTFHEFRAKLQTILPKLMDEVRQKANNLPRSHPLGKLVQDVPYEEVDDVDYDFDLNVSVALAGLPYLLPTTSKKTTLPHLYLLDVCVNNATTEDIRNAVEDRRQPYLQIFGTVKDRHKVAVVADKTTVCYCTTIPKALYAVLSMYYVLNVEYPSAVTTSLTFLQMVCLGLPEKKPQTRVLDLIRRVTA